MGILYRTRESSKTFYKFGCMEMLILFYSDLIFNVPKLISFLSRGTTLTPGTAIVTGTPAGVGMGTKDYIKHGEEIAIEILPHIGTLITRYEDER